MEERWEELQRKTLKNNEHLTLEILLPNFHLFNDGPIPELI